MARTMMHSGHFMNKIHNYHAIPMFLFFTKRRNLIPLLMEQVVQTWQNGFLRVIWEKELAQ